MIEEASGSAQLSVVIPAHNEASVIERCLSSLVPGGSSSLNKDSVIGEVIVVCNGCTDNTAALARQFENRLPGLVVIETATASKPGALNLGDAAATYFPRIYMDADIVCSAGDLVRAAASLASSEDGILCTAPSLEVDLDRASIPVKAFYAVWLRLPYFADRTMVGSGVFILSKAGRERFDDFPDIIADDGFVRTRFTRAERQTVDGAVFRIQAPADIHSLIRIKTRARLGNLELARRFPGAAIGGDNGLGALMKLAVRKSWLMPAMLIYVLVQHRTRTLAARRMASNELSGWERDESSRIPQENAEAPQAQKNSTLRVLMISSSGGHWKQLQRLRPAFEKEELHFACTDSDYRELVVGRPFYTVPEASLSGKVALLWQALVVFVLMFRVRPDVVVTTGAAPGFFALLFARKIHSPIVMLWRGRAIKTIWVDSIANVDELSVSGRQAACLADMHLTQWSHLADCISPGKPTFSGAVL